MSAPLPLTFLTSAAELHQLPDTPAEVAVLGRSNVGKSSLLNALARKRDVAKVSGKPGRTQLLNAFRTEAGATVVDLPGYGYAATASARSRAGWQERMERYLTERAELVLILALIDGVVGPVSKDLPTLAWMRHYELPFQVVATKHDKVKPSRRQVRARDLAAGCGVPADDVVWVSATTRTGVDRLAGVVRAAIRAA